LGKLGEIRRWSGNGGLARREKSEKRKKVGKNRLEGLFFGLESAIIGEILGSKRRFDASKRSNVSEFGTFSLEFWRRTARILTLKLLSLR